MPGWRCISIPFDDFTRATDFQPGGAPDDGFTLTEIWAWAIVLPEAQIPSISTMSRLVCVSSTTSSPACPPA